MRVARANRPAPIPRGRVPRLGRDARARRGSRARVQIGGLRFGENAAVMKSLLGRMPLAASAWSAWRRAQLHRQYEERRERYAAAARERGLRCSEDGTVAAVRARLAARGISPVRRAPGEIHTFAFIPSYTWHEGLLPDLAEVGRLTVFDYRC